MNLCTNTRGSFVSEMITRSVTSGTSRKPWNRSCYDVMPVTLTSAGYGAAPLQSLVWHLQCRNFWKQCEKPQGPAKLWNGHPSIFKAGTSAFWEVVCLWQLTLVYLKQPRQDLWAQGSWEQEQYLGSSERNLWARLDGEDGYGATSVSWSTSLFKAIQHLLVQFTNSFICD